MQNREIFYHNKFNEIKYQGFVQDAFEFIEDFQLLNPTVWRRFVQQFREDADGRDAGWRGEYWGKMMRGASLVYSYTKNEKLYEILCTTVRDMIDSADEDGRISSYAKEREFDGWDMWSRKYVLLGMQYFLDVCEDEQLKADMIASMRRQADCIMEKVGEGEGKKDITMVTRHWRGLNSSSVLEPIVRLYNLTGEQKYFDFAKYIVDCGGTDVVNIFDLAYEDQLYPYQYPVTKAYEMTSCFEGLLEFYKITGIERYKTSIVNFANKVLESDFTVIGSCGCTHELFDHSTVRQANTTNGDVAQETCVTVTIMKFLYRVHLLTGEAKYVDAFETAFYNAYLGSINTDKVVEPSILRDYPDWVAEPLPFDSYSPLTAGTRGNKIGGLKVMSDMHYYGCCACIGAAGIGFVPHMQLLSFDEGLVLNLFVNGTIGAKTPSGKDVKISVDTAYPKCGKVTISIKTQTPESFELRIRKPEWSKNTKLALNGKALDVCEGYISINNEWSDDVIELELDMRTEAIYPIPYGSQVLMNKVIWGHNYMIPTYDAEDPIAHKHIALRRGPVMLAQENRLGYSVDDPIEVVVGEDGYVEVSKTDAAVPYNSILKLAVPLADGSKMTVTDYASAGKTFNEESKMAVWMLTK